MDKGEFARLFSVALKQAAATAEEQLGLRVPRAFRIRLHGAGYAGDLVDSATALDALYLGPDRFYRIIDVGVLEVDTDVVTVFVRVSGHRPTPFDQTWNTPPGNGPFKQIIAQNIRVSGRDVAP